jgi:hypothetical protein
MNQPDACSIANLKTRQKKASVVAASISILAFVTLTVAQTPSDATESSEVAAIDAYCKELDDFKNSERNRARILGAEVDQTDVPKWKEFKSRRARGKAFFEDVADVWMKNEKLVVAELNSETNSGDWSKFVQYYFRDDGTLAKMRTTFAGFMVFSEHGGGRIVQERIYSSSGKLLQKRLRCFELEKTHRRIKCSGDYSNYDGTYYRRAQNLVFYGLLKSRPSRKMSQRAATGRP